MNTNQSAGQMTGRIDRVIQEIASQRHIPTATYRLQFHDGFTFRQATALIDYLDDLGIGDLYASPLFLPRQGSTHGYDVADPTRLNSDLGSDEDFATLTNTLQQHKMGLLLDIVPNHMGINDPRNGWWLDVLENGPSSDYATFFDIQWHPIKQELENKVLLPILGDQYGLVLERGEIRLNYDNGSFYFTYYDTVLPLAPHTYIPILSLAIEGLGPESQPQGEPALEPLAETIAAGLLPNGAQLAVGSLPADPTRMELESIITALGYLPPRTESDPQRRAERTREKVIIKQRIQTLYNEQEAFRRALDNAIRQINGEVGRPQSFDRLDALIEGQAYRLAFWRVAGEEINYRRFFDINELAAIRVEEPQVFAATHALALRLLANGQASALRIDHPDGLYDPVTYFRNLQEHYLFVKVQARLNAENQETGTSPVEAEAIFARIRHWLEQATAGDAATSWPLYVVAEKILSESEPLPLDWAVSGTTGYDFLASVNGIFVDRRNEKRFTSNYRRFSRNRTSLAEITFATKLMIMRNALVGEITTLAYELERIGERNRHYRDFTLGGIRTALREVIAALSVYRTYIDAQRGTVAERDRKFVQAAVREAKRRHPLLDDTLFEYIEQTLLLENLNEFSEAEHALIAHWVMRFQQLTGPVMAKGVEDTAFYRYNRLISLNEVGDHPAQFGLAVETFHRENSRRARLWPHAMVATSTHDNKRSEDVRARINVLSELPDQWQAALSKWSRLNAGKKREVDGEAAPSPNDEYLFYQTLLGTWPLAQPSQPAQPDDLWGFLLPPGDGELYQTFRRRISDYMLKAVKEAKVYTSWLSPNEEYEGALQRFIERALQPSARNRFLTNLAPLARRVAYYGQINSLAQTLLKLTVPGVPDIYQGNELWDFSLVDPDNRRPVDYEQRRPFLREFKQASQQQGDEPNRFIQSLVEQWPDGRIKLFVTQRTLQFRRSHPELFANGDYVPLEVVGERADHLCAYLRQDEQGEQLVVVVPRLVATLTTGSECPPLGSEIWGGERHPLAGD